MKTIIFIITLLLSCIFFNQCSSSAEEFKDKHIIANPLNLNYRFQFDDPSRREAADPVIEYFKGKYYLFASKSGGYWSSPDLYKWTYIPCTTLPIEAYAPTILVLDDSLYFMASGGPAAIYKTAQPDIDNWQPVDTKFEHGITDPAFLKDDNGRVYLYWGCSDVDPIMGVEVNPKDGFKMIGKSVVLIKHNIEKYGWEVPGNKNEENRTGWNEGASMIKHKDKYYLQYAAPGTQYRTYGDGVYTSDNPLGPFVYEENNPFSFKPGGFIGGAGHGHTFQDKYGNFWHVATMVISVRHMFERRIGLFPAYFSNDGDKLYAHTLFTDYPFYIPDKKIDLENNDCSMKWNMLSYGKAVKASSFLPGYDTQRANDEQIETWWAAQSGDVGEWWQVDLGTQMDVNAIQINFADHDFVTKAPDSYVCYQYYIECSDDASNWKRIIDKTANAEDMPHELVVLEKAVNTRYIRITNAKRMDGKFSMSGFRVFGNGKGEVPSSAPELEIERDKVDTRIIRFDWEKQDDVTGYIIRWGVRKNQLKNALMVYENKYEGRFFNRDSEYYFSIDSFNENGVTKGQKIYSTIDH